MSEVKEITLKVFQEKLNIYYSKDNGESATDEIVEKFSAVAVSHNKDNNPFFLAELLQSIKTRNIPLSELVVLDGTIVKEIFHEARQKAIVQQELLKENNSQNNINNPIGDNLEEQKKLTEDNIVQAFSEYDSILQKYDNDWDKLMSQGSPEEVKRITQISMDLGLMQEGDDILVEWQANGFREKYLTPEEYANKKIIERLEQFGVVVEEDGHLSVDIENRDKICNYTKGAHTVKCLVEDFLKRNPNVTAQEIKDSLLKIDNNIEVREYFKHASYEKFTEFCSNMQTKIIAQNKTRKNQSTTYIEKSNSEIEMLDMQGGTEVITSDVLEGYFDLEFASMDDPARANMEQVIEGIETDELIFDQSFEQFESGTHVLEELTQSELTQPELTGEESVIEEAYETPTMEVEKKGLAKWFDELKQSSNPLARLITGQIGKKQNNLLNSADNQKQAEEKPEGVSTSSLVPVIAEKNPVKRAMNRIGEGIMNVFRGDKKNKEPENVPVPVKVSDFNSSIAVGQDIKDNTTAVGRAAGKETSKVIVPQGNKIFSGNDSKAASEGPSLED